MCRWAGDGECDDGGPGASYDVCAHGTDCTDCGPRDAGPTAGGPTGSGVTPHAGLDLDSMSIPRAGLDNPTLASVFGIATEPYGDLVASGGLTWVRGGVSWFGGPADTGVGATATVAITGERARALNDPVNPSATVLESRPEDYYYCAMRWRYAPRGRVWLASARVVVRNPTTGTTIVVRPVDWGPGARTGRIIDLSPQSLTDLGLVTDQDALVAWAPPGTALGPVR